MKLRLSDERTQWRISLASLSFGAALIYLWDLANGQRSEYYAAIAMAMSKSFSNLFFGTLDPGGSVTLDKIPGSYWIPAIFVKIFGFSTWAVNAPNAIATVCTVIVVAITIKNLYGKTAGLIAGAIFATTPIVAAVSRSNQPQSYFLLTLAISAWAAVKALQNNSRKYLILAGVWIAVAFHTYMLEAWALWPALIIAYLFTEQKMIKKFIDLLIAGTTSLILSLMWIIIVTLIPASHRPYIGGTYHNNPIEMVFGYNGLGRFTSSSNTLSSSSDSPIFRSFTPPFGGVPGIGRLFNYNVGGQIAWLIPTTIVAFIIVIIFKQNRAITAFFAGWAIVFFAMFSAVGGIHQFYVSSLALPMAALIASAIALARKAKSINSEIALLGTTALWTFYLANNYKNYFSWAPYVQGVAAIIGIYVATHVLRHRFEVIVPLILILGITTTPAMWAIDVRNHANSINPIAGPISAEGSRSAMGLFGRGPGGFNSSTGRGQQLPFNNNFSQNFPQHIPNGMPNGIRNGFQPFGQQANTELIKYLKENRGGAKYLLATFGAQPAATFITATGEPVLPIGGFDGQDPTPTLTEFKKLIDKGELRYIQMNDGASRGIGGHENTASSSEISTWVTTNCTLDSNAPGSGDIYICSKSQ